VFVSIKPFKPGVMYVSRAGAYLSGASFTCSLLVYAPGLNCKHYTRLERHVRDKYTSLLGPFVRYEISEPRVRLYYRASIHNLFFFLTYKEA
jgi:hypothetical protein